MNHTRVTKALYSSSVKGSDQVSGFKAAFFIPAGIAIVASTYGLARYAYGLFLPRIQDDMALSLETMGLIASTSYLGYLLATLIAMSISATFGPRFPIVLGGFMATAGMMLIATSSSASMLILGVFMAGTSPGLSYPPLSDAIIRVVTLPKRERAYAWINSGTSFGVILAGPIALWAGESWRTAWVIFALAALVSTLWNWAVMPAKNASSVSKDIPKLNIGLFQRKSAGGLYTAAFLFGIITSVYWTFAVDLLVSDNTLPERNAVAFWVLIGIAGILGCFAGDIVNRIGMKAAFKYMMLAITCAIAILPLATKWSALALISGALFGATFISITAVFGIWSIYIYNDRPSAGFGATFFLISLGQFVGPVIAGYGAAQIGMGPVFYASALFCLGLITLTPKTNTHSMTV